MSIMANLAGRESRPNPLTPRHRSALHDFGPQSGPPIWPPDNILPCLLGVQKGCYWSGRLTTCTVYDSWLHNATERGTQTDRHHGIQSSVIKKRFLSELCICTTDSFCSTHALLRSHSLVSLFLYDQLRSLQYSPVTPDFLFFGIIV